ncbi:hypothetical protein J7E68_01055, partial [Microbacterium sp. ISL-103]|uniref:DUF5979 domain-containing protein n=1 Tax=Microbacterium sp. ISL-103 TaxID=2819156 RepID=UPI001BEA401C
LVKEVTGGAVSLVDDDRTYTVKTQIDTSALGAGFPAQPDREVTLVAGEPVLVEDLPIGATVTFTETRPTDDDTLTWSEPTISPSSLVVSAATATDPALVTVTNRVERTVGTFSLTKNVTGAQAENPAVPATVTVNASWIEDGTLGSATLTLPTDGTPVPFGRSLLIGTEVTLEEVPLADGASIAWSAPVWSGAGVTVDGESAVVTIGRDPAAAVVVENHAATSTAGISIIKGIAGEAAGAVDSDTPFAVEATWTDADGTPQSRELTITADGPVALGEQLPAGTVVTLTEQDPPQVDTVTWGSIVISGTDVIDDGNGSARVTIPDQQGDVLLVTVINEATWTPGTFTITKSFDGIRPDDADIPSDITVTASWDEAGTPQSVEMTVPTDGTPVTYPDTLAFGTQVTLRETPLPDATRFTWAHPSWDGERVSTTDQGDATVTIGADDNASVALTNTAVESRGSLIIAKSVTGTGADDVAATPFPLVVSWIDLLGEPQARDVVVIPGDTVEVEDIPLGIAVRIEEKTATLADDLRWSGARWSTTSSDITVDTAEGSPIATVVLSGDTESLELENTVEKISGLATTGGAVSLLAAGLAASAIIFGLLLVRR